MAAKSTFRNMVLVLGAICLICSALLGGVYAITKAPIEAANLATTNAAIAEVVPSFDNLPSDDKFSKELNGVQYSVYTAKMGGNIVGYAIESVATGFGGPIKLMVGFDAQTGAIYNTQVISHAETPGLGAKITENGEGNFREQFKGKNPQEFTLTVKKDGGDIDAITASTITSRAFAVAVAAATDVMAAIMAESAATSQNIEEVK